MNGTELLVRARAVRVVQVVDAAELLPVEDRAQAIRREGRLAEIDERREVARPIRGDGGRARAVEDQFFEHVQVMSKQAQATGILRERRDRVTRRPLPWQ